MATNKDKKEVKRTTDFSFSSSVRNNVVPMGNDTDKNERDIPWSLLIAVIVLCFVLVIALPVMGIMYMDMNNATVMAMEEVKKMRELRAKILMQMQGE
jgi:amino acid permease